MRIAILYAASTEISQRKFNENSMDSNSMSSASQLPAKVAAVNFEIDNLDKASFKTHFEFFQQSADGVLR